MCALTYCRIEEIQEIPVLEESSPPQPRTAVPQAAPKVLAPLLRPRPLKPQNDDDDISRYSRVQIIDTSFQIQKAGESKIVAGIATLSVEELDDPERLAAYLATVCGLPEEDCLVALKECETQLLAIRAESNNTFPIEPDNALLAKQDDAPLAEPNDTPLNDAPPIEPDDAPPIDVSPVGNISFFNPLAVPLWNQSVEGAPILGKDIFFASQQEFPDMTEHLPESFFPKDYVPRVESESLVGNNSFFNPLAVPLWNQSVEGAPIPEKDLFFASQQEFPDMTGHLPESFLPKTDVPRVKPESLVGNNSFFNPLAVPLWNQSFEGAPISGNDLFFVSQQEFPDMTGHLPEYFLLKDDAPQ